MRVRTGPAGQYAAVTVLGILAVTAGAVVFQWQGWDGRILFGIGIALAALFGMFVTPRFVRGFTAGPDDGNAPAAEMGTSPSEGREESLRTGAALAATSALVGAAVGAANAIRQRESVRTGESFETPRHRRHGEAVVSTGRARNGGRLGWVERDPGRQMSEQDD